MTHHGRTTLAASLTFGLAFAAPLQGDDLEALRARLEKVERDNQQLRAEVSQFRNESNDNWLTGKRAQEVRALVEEVIADADTRASLLADGMTAGHQNGAFYMGSNDGRFLLQIGGLIQARYLYNHRGSAPGGNDQNDRDEAGFDMARIRLEVAGYIGDPRFTYAIRFGPDREDAEVLGEKAVIGYHPNDKFSIYAGDDKAGFLREETTSPAMQLAVERSLMAEMFTVGYVQGVWATWQVHDNIQLYASLNDGVRSGEQDNEFNSAFITAPPGDGDLQAIHKSFFLDRTDIAATFRIDWKIDGDWSQYEDFAAWSGEPFAAFLGAAVHLELGETGSSAGGGGSGSNDNFLLWTIDGSIEYNGFNFFGAIAGLHTDLESQDNLDMYGVVLQAGYMIIPDKLEPFARIEWIDLDGRNTTGKNDIIIVTVGANYYLIRHQAKISADLMWVANNLPGSSVLGLQDNQSFDQTLGHLGLRASEDYNQWVLRIQFQLLF